MTEKTLRERLPKGAARNKIEFLADQMDLTAGQLLETIQTLGTPVKNYVRNPAFLDCSSNQAQQTKFEGVLKPGAIQNSANQNAGTFADGWNFEQDGNKLDPAGQISFSAHRNLDFPLNFASLPFKANDIWCSVNNCKAAIYQMLYLPRKEAYYKARCFYAASEGATLVLGFRVVDPYEVGRPKAERTVVTSGELYAIPPAVGYDIKTLESDVYKVSRSQNNHELVYLEMQSRPGKMDHIMLLGIQVYETDKDGNPLDDGDIAMTSDGNGYSRFVESIEFICVDTTVTGNRFQFKAKNTVGSVMDCPHGIENHVLLKQLSYWGAAGQSGSYTNDVEIVGYDGGLITLALSQQQADTVRSCGGMYFYARYTRTPLIRGLY